MPHDLLFTLNVGAVKAAYAVYPDFEGRIPLLLIRNNDGKISFVLPKERLKIYTIVRLE